jgi:hypothetical protein
LFNVHKRTLTLILSLWERKQNSAEVLVASVVFSLLFECQNQNPVLEWFGQLSSLGQHAAESSLEEGANLTSRDAYSWKGCGLTR